MNFYVKIFKNMILDLPSILSWYHCFNDLISGINKLIKDSMVALSITFEHLLMNIVLESADQLDILKYFVVVIKVFLNFLNVLQHFWVVVESK